MQAALKSGRAEDSRRELMSVAIDCFAKYGFQATSIDRIAKAAGVTKGALYYHFKDKDELLYEAVKNRVGQFERKVTSSVDSREDAPGVLRNLGRICFEHATKSNHRRLIVTLMVEALDTNARVSAEFRAMMERFRGFLQGVIRGGQKRGQFRPDIDANVAAEVYAGAIMGAEIQYYQDPEAFDLAATIEAFLDQFIFWLSAVADGAKGTSRNGKKRRNA